MVLKENDMRRVIILLMFGLIGSGLFAQTYIVRKSDAKGTFTITDKLYFETYGGVKYISFTGDTIFVNPWLKTPGLNVTGDANIYGTATIDTAHINVLTATKFTLGTIAMDSVKLSYESWQLFTDKNGDDQNIFRLSPTNSIQIGTDFELPKLFHLPDTYTDWLNIGMTSDGDYGDKAGGSAYIGSTLMMDIRALNDGTGGIVDGSDYVYLNGVWVNDENWTQSTITDDTQLGSIPAKYLLEYVIFQETAGNAATLDLGTTSGASDVFLNQVVAASTWTTITVPNAYSITGATTLFLNDDDGSSDWNSASVNVYLVFKKFAE